MATFGAKTDLGSGGRFRIPEYSDYWRPGTYQSLDFGQVFSNFVPWERKRVSTQHRKLEDAADDPANRHVGLYTFE